MSTIEWVLGSLIIAVGLFLVVAVLMQSGKDKSLSGTIAGGSETYYGKDKSGGIDKKLFKWTLIAAIVFAVAVIAVYVIQPDYIEGYDVNAWEKLTQFSSIFTTTK